MGEIELADVALGDPFVRKSAGRGGWYSYRDNVLWIEGQEVQPRLVGHEFTHFLQHCSTPYGFFLDELNMRQMNLSTSLLSELSGTCLTPVYRWARETLAGGARSSFSTGLSAELVSAFVKPWSQRVQLEQVFEGRDCVSVRETDQASAVRLTEALEGTNDGVGDLDVPFGNGVKADKGRALPVVEGTSFQGSVVEGCPKVTWWDGGSRPVGAWHVAETFAQLGEGFTGEDVDRLGQEYLTLFPLAIMAYGTERLDDRDATWKPVAPTCMVLADLALFTPVGAVYKRLRPPGSTWGDIHPGYRFLAALEVVKSIGGWVGELTEGEHLAAEICSRVGWPPPAAFLELGASLRSERFARHRDACRLRQSDLYCFYRSSSYKEGSRCGEFLEKHFPIVRHPAHAQTIVWPDNPTPVIRDCFLARLCWYVMGGNTPLHRELLLPDDIWYDQLYDNVSTRDEMIDLVLAKRPWASFERFRWLGENGT